MNKNGKKVSLHDITVHDHTGGIINASVVIVISIGCVACMSMDKRWPVTICTHTIKHGTFNVHNNK